MNLSLYLEQLYHKKFNLIKTNHGLSNDIYETEYNGEKWAVRVVKNDLNNIIGKDELAILDLIKTTNLDVEEIYYDPNTRLRITKWVDSLEFKEYLKPDRYDKAVTLIKELHTHAFKVDKVFDIYSMYQAFKTGIKKPLMNYEKYEIIFEHYAHLDEPKILCHNDLVSGNFLFGKERSYLIDYEYASMNYALFDLMSFITENNIDDVKIRHMIYLDYFGHEPSKTTMHKLLIIENAQNLLWAAWANMLYDSRQEKIYLEIFNDKFQHLINGINCHTVQ